ncbi:MAG: TonB-dependent receptor [Pyrinomonadaceae bacterium]|nr:TonB-dependent receptor [Pyrinomonadaceae bacterium]
MLCLQASASQGSTPQEAARLAGPAGIVTDETGAPVSRAEVTLNNGSSVLKQVTTDGDGRFAFEATPTDAATLTIEARGFRRYEQSLTLAQSSATPLKIVLAPAPFAEQVTVTATRTETRLRDTAASVVVLSPEDLATTGALTIDDALRQVPGFQLFRRTSSRTANPTAQGVSLRGVGASGASRAVVLADGIPLNDPFGGWVYWGRVPRESLSRVEVLRGGGSDLYGSAALGGVINLFTKEIETPTLSFEASYGNQQTPDASIFMAGRRGRWGASLAAESFRTDGYVPVDERERGKIDTPAGSRRADVEVTLDRQIGEQGRVYVRGSYFGEARENGTPLQTNRTHIRQLSFGGDQQFESVGTFSVRAYGGTQVYDQNFSAVASDRNGETLTRVQRVPAQFAGFTSQWSRSIGRRQALVAGFDGREVRGASDEQIYVAGRASSLVGAGGRERTFGVFAQDVLSLTPRLIFTLGARVDRWRNYAALSTTRSLTGLNAPTVVNFPDRTETAFNPRASLLYKVTDTVSLAASAYRAFRAPTLNELYRAFRVGDVLTLANENLRAERLTGGEAGANFAPPNGRIIFRGLVYWSEITRPIANVTLRAMPNLITRQRQNLGRTRSRGVEIETDTRLSSRWSTSIGYLLTDATVLRFPVSTELEGLLIPQVPRHQLTFQTRYTNPSLVTLGLQGRAASLQFDDDQNRFPLGRYFTLDAFASRRISRGVEVFAAAENLLNDRYEIGRTPVRTIGPPLLARFGLRLRLGAQ